MSVVIETTIGDITVDLFLKERPLAALNFLKLCKLKYYNFNLFHTIQSEFIAQTGDPSGVGDGGMSIWGILEGEHKRYFEGETVPKIKHSEPGLLSMVNAGEHLIGSQFFFTLGADLTSLDGRHTVIGEVTEGHEVLRKLNEVICDERHRPYKDVRITHTVVLDDPFDDPRGFREPSRSPSPSAERLQGGRIAADEEIDDLGGKTEQEIAEMIAEREAKARATILEIVGDIPDADIAPPENVLFVCKLNPVTTDDDLQIIFSRFGMIKGCEVIRDKLTGDSLQYAFIEFENQKSCEDAYFKMDNVLIDDRRIHVDFSQSVSKVKWRGKGRGIEFQDGADKRSFKDFDRKKQQSNRNGGSRMERQNVSPKRGREQEKQRNRSESRSRSRSASRSRPIKADRSRQRSRSRDRVQNRDRDTNRSAGRNVQESGNRARKPKLTERNSAYLEQRNGRDIRINQGKVDYKNRPYPNSFVQRKGPRDKNAKRGGNSGPRGSSGKRLEPPRRRSRSRSRDRRMRRSRSGSRSRDRRNSSDRYRSYRSNSRDAKGRRQNDAERVVSRQPTSQQRASTDLRRTTDTKSGTISSDRDQQREPKPSKRRSSSSGSSSPPPREKRKRGSSRSSRSDSSSSSSSHSESDERSKKRKKKSSKKKSKSSSKSDRKRKDSVSSEDGKHRKKSKGKKKKRKH
ncbi:peptidyl-prolyl cis-trans isomerase sig-7 [Anopheles marshallii]|uniref:peptidyl-prolyl cis-trans isomerase sig-7 n=1 Tax=Anopheles marshallii TaxID=1521116 RepID=UPI00237B1C76|nr:peptidyl-prolyl cis-trans isomerase sig-7 [Anopheles marshallii]